jgi:hypothetical protein
VSPKLSAGTKHVNAGECEMARQRHDRDRLRNDCYDDRGPETVVGEAEQARAPVAVYS